MHCILLLLSIDILTSLFTWCWQQPFVFLLEWHFSSNLYQPSNFVLIHCISHWNHLLLMLQLGRPAHQLFAVCGRLVVLYQDGSLGSTDQLLYKADHAACSPFIVWSQLHSSDGASCIVVVFRDKVRSRWLATVIASSDKVSVAQLVLWPLTGAEPRTREGPRYTKLYCWCYRLVGIHLMSLNLLIKSSFSFTERQSCFYSVFSCKDIFRLRQVLVYVLA